jgi:hypothetical protein
MWSQKVLYFDGPGDICSSSEMAPISARASARSFSEQSAWFLIFINSTVLGHKRSSFSRGTRISKCTMSRCCHSVAGIPTFPISRRTRQSRKIKRLQWSGNCSRTRLTKSRRLASSARKEETGPPAGAENCRRGILSVPTAKPAPICARRHC